MSTVVALLHFAYRCRDLFIDVVINCEGLKIIFPEARKRRIHQIGLQFFMQKLQELYKRMCWCCWQLPSHNQPPNFSWKWQQPRFIFSGHCMTYGINDVQAVCDADSWFIYFGLIAQWKCSDQVAFAQTSIFDQVAVRIRYKFLSGRRCIIHIVWWNALSLCWLLTTWLSNKECINFFFHSWG